MNPPPLFDPVISLGFGLRFLSKYSPDSITLFAIEGLFIICAPATFLAFNYITYGRLISYVGAEHSIINPQKVAKIFVISDVFTFLLQVRTIPSSLAPCVLMKPSPQKAGGSGIQTSEKMASTGQKVVLVGLVLQAVSYGFFCLLLIKSHISIKSSGLGPMDKSYITLIWVLYFSSAFISVCFPFPVSESPALNSHLCRFVVSTVSWNLLRDVVVTSSPTRVRTNSVLSLHITSTYREKTVFLYLLDTLPLVLAIIVYVPFWPSKYLEHRNKESLEMNGGLHP